MDNFHLFVHTQQLFIKLYLIMGNVEQVQSHHTQHKSNGKVSNHKFVLEIRDRQIILDYKNKIKLIIGDVLSFPSGGYEGLHLWDANIILSRYILQNQQQFAGKSVIQLLAGTGIASITMKKYTKAYKIAATDKAQQVTSNISKNCIKNGISSGMIVACISWQQYLNYKAKFDFVIGADLLFKGCPVQTLSAVLNKLLNIGGKAIIVMPKVDQIENSCHEFFNYLNKQIFIVKKQKLCDQIYMESPLLNQVLGYQEFSQISDGQFYLYILQKISQQQQNRFRSESMPTKVQEAAYQIRPIQRKRQHTQFKKVQQKNTDQFQIKQEFFGDEKQQNRTQHLKKQLQIVKVKKNLDVSEFQRKKKRDLNDILNSQDNSKQTNSKKNQQRSNDGLDRAEQIQEVNKQHQLFDQPQKKSQSDRKSIHSQKQSGFGKIDVEVQKDNRMRKISNPH